MILTGETEVLGEKHYTASVVDEWMNEYGALVEWYWKGKTEVLGEKHYRALVVDEWMNEYGALVELYWQEKLKYWEKNIIQRWW